MGKQNTDTFRQIAEAIIKTDIIPEAKVVLLCMSLHKEKTMGFNLLAVLANCPVNELDYARGSLSADRVNINKCSDHVTLNPDWLKSFGEKNGIDLQVWFDGPLASEAPNESNGEPGDPEPDVHRDAHPQHKATGVLSRGKDRA